MKVERTERIWFYNVRGPRAAKRANQRRNGLARNTATTATTNLGFASLAELATAAASSYPPAIRNLADNGEEGKHTVDLHEINLAAWRVRKNV